MQQYKSIDSKVELPGFIIERTAKKMKHFFAKMLVELNVGFTVDQWIVLQVLYKEGPLNQFEIADRAFKDRPTITRIIDLLCEKGLVARKQDNQDRRRFMIHLTAKGTKEVSQLTPRVKNFRQKAYNGLSDHDIEQLRSIMDLIHSNLSE